MKKIKSNIKTIRRLIFLFISFSSIVIITFFVFIKHKPQKLKVDRCSYSYSCIKSDKEGVYKCKYCEQFSSEDDSCIKEKELECEF